MKRTSLIKVALLWVPWLVFSCASESGDRSAFIGTWQSLQVPTRKPLIIAQEGSAIVVSQGTKSFPATYDAEHHTLHFSAPLAGDIAIRYLSDKDQLLVTADGVYQRLK